MIKITKRGYVKFDWIGKKEEIMKVIRNGGSTKDVLNLLAEKYEYYPDENIVRGKLRKWKEMEKNG